MVKTGLNLFINSLNKWRNDLNIKKISHIKLLHGALDYQVILQC